MAYVLPILAVFTLLAVWRAGYLRPAALAYTPRREVEFGAADRVVVGGLVGVMFLPLAVEAVLPGGAVAEGGCRRGWGLCWRWRRR